MEAWLKMRSMGKGRYISIVLIAAVAFTAFYAVHEQLPRAIRAPTSLLLSHIAIASGLLGPAGIDVYGDLPLVFLLNLLVSALVVAACIAWLRRWRG